MRALLRRLTHAVSCKEATRLISEMQERPLAGREHLRLRLHLAACAACSRFLRQVAFMRRALSAYRSGGPTR
jgi:hypothetical protein